MWGMRYCKGFPKRKNPKRFKSSDPKYKAPKWCPRRISPPVCRVYGFASFQDQMMDCLTREQLVSKQNRYIYPTAFHYTLRLETTLGINARTFFYQSKHGELDDFLAEADLSPGEVVEIDDGLRPYFFYCWGWSKFIPAPGFERSRVQKGEM